MILKFKQYISESVWGDIRKKSLGQEDRIEHKISPEELFNYLNSRYEFRGSEIELDKKSNLIIIPIMCISGGMFDDSWDLSLNYHIDLSSPTAKESIIFSQKDFEEKCPKLYTKLCNNFQLENTEDGFISIIPDGENNFLISVLDMIADESSNDFNILISKNDTEI